MRCSARFHLPLTPDGLPKRQAVAVELGDEFFVYGPFDKCLPQSVDFIPPLFGAHYLIPVSLSGGSEFNSRALLGDLLAIQQNVTLLASQR
jgi:hypothetical protein